MVDPLKKRGRGRPRKIKNDTIQDDNSSKKTQKRGRGRPSKSSKRLCIGNSNDKNKIPNAKKNKRSVKHKETISKRRKISFSEMYDKKKQYNHDAVDKHYQR